MHRNDFICEAKHSQNSSYLYYAMIDITDMEGGGEELNPLAGGVFNVRMSPMVYLLLKVGKFLLSLLFLLFRGKRTLVYDEIISSNS